MAAPTSDELAAATVGIPSETLDERCTDEHLTAVSQFLTSLQDIAPYLGIDNLKRAAIEVEAKAEEEKRLKLLQKWKENDPLRATYRRLIEALLTVSRIDEAEKLCCLLRHPRTGDSLHPKKEGKEEPVRNAEEAALQKHWQSLQDLIDDPGELATKLCTAGVIGKLMCNGVQYSELSKVQKASKLLTAIEAQIKIDARIFPEVLTVLKQENTLQMTADLLEVTYREMQQHITTDVISGWELPRGTTATSLDSDESYDVYLSFADEDAAIAQMVYQHLTQKAGYKVAMIYHNFDNESVLHAYDAVARMIRHRSKKTVAILSPKFVESEWCMYEAKIALLSQPVGLQIICILYCQCAIPECLQMLYCLDYQAPHNKVKTEEEMRIFWQKLLYMVAASPEELLMFEMLQNSSISSTGSEGEGPLAHLSVTHDVVLSFANEDEAFAEHVCQLLIGQSFQVFDCPSEFTPGKIFIDELAATFLHSCRKVVILLSPEYIKDDMCLYETRLAMYAAKVKGSKNFIIPILCKDCEVPSWMTQLYSSVLMYPADVFRAIRIRASDPMPIKGYSYSEESSEYLAFQLCREELEKCLLNNSDVVMKTVEANIISPKDSEAVLTSQKPGKSFIRSIKKVVVEMEERIQEHPSVFHSLVTVLSSRRETNLGQLAYRLDVNCRKFAAGKLDGVSYISSYLSKCIDSSGETINWSDYGISVQIPPDAVPKGQQLQLMLGCAVSIPRALPDGYDLVSPVYLIMPSFHFKKMVEISMEHWATIHDHKGLSSLSFVSAPVHSIEPSKLFRFKLVNGGKFEVNSSIGSICLKHFCFFAIARAFQTLNAVAANNEYTAMLYRPIQCTAHPWTAVFSVTVRCKAFEQALRENLEKCYRTSFRTTARRIQFSESRILLDIPYQVAESQGYKITTDQEPCEVLKVDVDDAIKSPNCFQVVDDVYPPRIHIEVTPIDYPASQTSHLDCQLRLVGTAEDVVFRLTSPAAVRAPDAPASVLSWQRETPLGIDDIMEISAYLQTLNKEQLFELGLVLGLSYTTLEKMKTSATFLDDMLATWLREQDLVGTREFGRPSWQTLVVALEHAKLKQTGIANRIAAEKGIVEH